MDADRSGERMNDLDVDRELRALISVDPPPEFTARVRMRVAAEPQRSPWLAWWPLAAAAAIAVAIAAAFVARPRPADAPQALGATPLPATAALAVPLNERPSVADDPGRPARGRRPAPDVPRRVEAGPAIDAAASDVLLDPRETAALRALITGVRTGRVDLEPVLRASAVTAMEFPPVAPITIQSIMIEPLEEGGRR